MRCISSEKCSEINGEIIVPGDKSISHRALIIGSMVTGKIIIKNLLESEDVLATSEALKNFGIILNKKDGVGWEILGSGIGNLVQPLNTINMGNSGTGVRLLMGLVAGSDIEATFIGDESLSKRPMKRIVTPLCKMGAKVNNTSGRLPIKIKGNKIPLPVEYESPISSAQVKSSILLAGLSSIGTTSVIEPSLSRDHTERMLKYLGASINTTRLENSSWKITLKGIPNLKPLNIDIPSDPSSAAFPIVSAIITPKSKIKVLNVCINDLRIGLYKSLIEMGANIKFSNLRQVNGETIADITAMSSKLNGITIPKSRVASMIDEYPILSIAAVRATGNTIMEGVEELRYKETDRIKAVCEGLNQMGIKTTDTKNSMKVHGLGPKATIKGDVEIYSKLDHRIAMCFLCLGLTTEKPIIVKDTDTINSSFPLFLEKMNKIGAKLDYV